MLVFPEAGTNTAQAAGEPSPDLFDGCEVVVRLRNHPSAIGAVADRDPGVGGALGGRRSSDVLDDDAEPSCGAGTSWRSTWGLEPESVHVITPAVGGGFGAKGEWYHDQLLVAWLSRHVGRRCGGWSPVRRA